MPYKEGGCHIRKAVAIQGRWSPYEEGGCHIRKVRTWHPPLIPQFTLGSPRSLSKIADVGSFAARSSVTHASPFCSSSPASRGVCLIDIGCEWEVSGLRDLVGTQCLGYSFGYLPIRKSRRTPSERARGTGRCYGGSCVPRTAVLASPADRGTRRSSR